MTFSFFTIHLSQHWSLYLDNSESVFFQFEIYCISRFLFVVKVILFSTHSFLLNKSYFREIYFVTQPFDDSPNFVYSCISILSLDYISLDNWHFTVYKETLGMLLGSFLKWTFTASWNICFLCIQIFILKAVTNYAFLLVSTKLFNGQTKASFFYWSFDVYWFPVTYIPAFDWDWDLFLL